MLVHKTGSPRNDPKRGGGYKSQADGAILTTHSEGHAFLHETVLVQKSLGLDQEYFTHFGEGERAGGAINEPRSYCFF